MLSSARERASIPSAQSVSLARVVSARRSRASAARAACPLRAWWTGTTKPYQPATVTMFGSTRLTWASARPACGAQLETVVAGTEGPGPLRQLLDASDVLVSTAGPFVKIGPGGRGCGGGRGRGIPGLHR